MESYDYYEILKEKIDNNLKRIYFDEPEEVNFADSLFYRQCMDKAKIDQLGHIPVEKILHKLTDERWPIISPSRLLPSWQQLYAKLFPLNINFLFTISHLPNPDQNHRSNLLFEQVNSESNMNLIDIEDMMHLFITSRSIYGDINPVILHDRAIEIILFEKRLIKLKTDFNQWENARISFETFNQKTGIDWINLMNEITRNSMKQFISIIGTSKRIQFKTDYDLIKQTLLIFRMAQKMANSEIPNERWQIERLKQLLDQSQIELIKQWLNNDNMIEQLMFTWTNNPMFNCNDVVLVDDIGYFKRLNSLLQSTPRHVLFNYVGWKTIYTYQNYIGGQAWNILHRSIPFSPVPLWKHCIDRVIKVYPWNVSHRYLKRFIPIEIKSNVMALVQNVQITFKQMIIDSNWIDQQTKKNAIEKLEAMKLFIAYPDWLVSNYSNLAMEQLSSDNCFLTSAIKKLSFDRIWKLLIIRLTPLNDFNGWFNAPIVVDAYNSPNSNSITIPFSIIQPPFYVYNYSTIINYGGLVPIISHELIHGFDTMGSRFDWRGNVANWWQAKSEQIFEWKSQCFIHQYEQIVEPITGRRLNGRLTISENIADNGAIRLAYNAFKRVNIVQDETFPEAIDHFNLDQLFFLQYAQV
ncbi:hypothetical protein RDWZM_006156 [Blomia tropicalis]|uniref:Uncharacterized protein n=1 Tax=Blomia tropicalis TaxID=40697 RepID=A0A9Q0RN18_BLOTA|nr:hypothetical protein RDWZM_006156 [Blomia tropicalis]